MPPKGVKTRTVASSFHIKRPVRGTPAERSAAAGSTLKEVSCGESAENETVLPLTFASDCGTALSAGLHPTRDRQSRERSGTRHRVNAFRRLDQALVPQGCLRIAQRFSVGEMMPREPSPEGTAEFDSCPAPISRPFGTCARFVTDPTLKRWAILVCPSGTAPCNRSSKFPKRIGVGTSARRGTDTALPPTGRRQSDVGVRTPSG